LDAFPAEGGEDVVVEQVAVVLVRAFGPLAGRDLGAESFEVGVGELVEGGAVGGGELPVLGFALRRSRCRRASVSLQPTVL
jgi:hypothetical protein